MAKTRVISGTYRASVRKLRAALKSVKKWNDKAIVNAASSSAGNTFQFLESNAVEQAHNKLLRRCDEVLAARLV